MPPDAPRKVARILPASTEYPLTATFWGSDIDVYQVLGSDLDRIRASASSSGLYLAFFGIAVGAALSFGLLLATVEVKDPRAYAAFVALFGVSAAAMVFLGIKARLEWKETKRELASITEGRRKLGTAQGVFTSVPPSIAPDTQRPTKR